MRNAIANNGLCESHSFYEPLPLLRLLKIKEKKELFDFDDADEGLPLPSSFNKVGVIGSAAVPPQRSGSGKPAPADVKPGTICGIPLKQLMKSQPAVAASQLRTKSLKQVNDLKALIDKSLASADATMLESKKDGVDHESDPILTQISRRRELVAALSSSSSSTSLERDVSHIVENDAFFREAGILPESLRTLGQIEYMRNVQVNVQSSVDSVLSVFEQHNTAVTAGNQCATALSLGWIVNSEKWI